MKSLLTILLICFCFVGYGQVHSDTTSAVIGRRTASGTDSIYSLLSIYSTSTSLTFYSKPKYDTVKVIMLVCDTSSVTIIDDYRIAKGVLDSSYHSRIRTKNVYWQFGYAVRELNTYYYIEPRLLDDNKKRLPSNIFVWTYTFLNKQ